MSARLPLALAIAAAGAALSACGGGGGSASVPANAPPGAKVYSQANCGSCHKLKAVASTGTAGPDLDQSKPTESVVEQFVLGGGSGMPAFKDQLSEQQIQEVSSYVADVAGR